MWDEDMIRDCFNQLIDLYDQDKCLEYLDYENVKYSKKNSRYEFPKIYAKKWGWGWRRNALPEIHYFNTINVPININVLLREFQIFIYKNTEFMIHPRFKFTTFIFPAFKKNGLGSSARYITSSYPERIMSIQPKAGNTYKSSSKEISRNQIVVPVMSRRYILDLDPKLTEFDNQYISTHKNNMADLFYSLKKLDLLDKISFRCKKKCDDKIYKIVGQIIYSPDQFIFIVSDGKENKVAKIISPKQKSAAKNFPHSFMDSEIAEYEIINNVDVYFEETKCHHSAKLMDQLTKISDIKADFNKMYMDIITFLCSFHAKKLLHGDLKYNNLMYSEKTDKYVVIDFDNMISVKYDQSDITNPRILINGELSTFFWIISVLNFN